MPEYNVPDVAVTGAQFSGTVVDRVNIVSQTIQTPAAGADMTVTVPNGVMWDVQSFNAKFTASAQAANRLLGFQVKDASGNLVYQYQCTAAVATTVVVTVTFSEDCTVVPTTLATGNIVLFPSPKAWFMGGWTFGTFTGSIQTNDTWTLGAMWAAEYLPTDTISDSED